MSSPLVATNEGSTIVAVVLAPVVVAVVVSPPAVGRMPTCGGSAAAPPGRAMLQMGNEASTAETTTHTNTHEVGLHSA